MALAVNTLAPTGGICVVSKHKAYFLPLEIAGLMSKKSLEEVLKKRLMLEKKMKELQIEEGIEPLMLLSFLSLVVIPEAKITCNGLFSFKHQDYFKNIIKKEN